MGVIVEVGVAAPVGVWMVGKTLDAVAIRAPRGPRRPGHICLDKGYDYADSETRFADAASSLIFDLAMLTNSSTPDDHVHGGGPVQVHGHVHGGVNAHVDGHDLGHRGF